MKQLKYINQKKNTKQYINENCIITKELQGYKNRDKFFASDKKTKKTEDAGDALIPHCFPSDYAAFSNPRRTVFIKASNYYHVDALLVLPSHRTRNSKQIQDS